MNSNITQEAIEVARSASKYYALIKDIHSCFQVKVSDGFRSYSKSVDLNYYDRRTLSLFFALLTVSDNTYNIFSDFNITFDDVFMEVFSSYDIDNNEHKKDVTL